MARAKRPTTIPLSNRGLVTNVFAILGLRSLYFVLANAIGYFRFLKIGLSVVLIFVGLKMLLPFFHEKFDLLDAVKISTQQSLLVIAGIILASILCSVIAEWREKQK